MNYNIYVPINVKLAGGVPGSKQSIKSLPYALPPPSPLPPTDSLKLIGALL